jgi:V/A-type H+-transporting ATPase subunit I
MGIAALTKVAVMAPRSDYQEVVKMLSRFQDFHTIEHKELQFDPATQELSQRAVRLLAQVDQVVKDLSIPLNPAVMDILFRGVKIQRAEYEASGWRELLDSAEKEAEPVRTEIRAAVNRYSQLTKEESETRVMMDALRAVSSISADLSRLSSLKRVRAVLLITEQGPLMELQKSFPELLLISQPINPAQSLVIVGAPREDSARLDKVLKTLDMKPFTLPENLPQNPAEAYRKLDEDLKRITVQRTDAEAEVDNLRERHAEKLLSIRELAESARNMLDEVRATGGLQRIATVSGYIPASRENEFVGQFDSWIVFHERVNRLAEGHEAKVPTLFVNRGPAKTFELITREQGIPGGPEVDPTPIVTFVFPVFFGIMFGDLGHGLIFTAFAYLMRRRGTGNLRQWGNIFLAAGISACVMGVIVGEFFGFSLYQLFKIPTVVEIVLRPPVVQQATLDPAGTTLLLVLSIFIGIAHITTGLLLDIIQAIRGHETVELLTHKIPSLIMYVSGIGFGFAFIGAGYSFNVLARSNPVPLLGVPTNTLGGVSLVVVFSAMIVLAAGRGIAIMAGKVKGETAGSAFANGGIEVFEAISRFLANTISYVRLAIMLFVHAALLLTVNMLLVFPLYISLVPLVIFNVLIILFEVLIVYIQDLRLHIYEFFTKFFEARGEPFQKLFADRIRFRINWT